MRVWGSCDNASQVMACASIACGRLHKIMAALVPLRRVSSTTHVGAMRHVWGRVRGDNNGVQEACFLYANQHPPPGWVL